MDGSVKIGDFGLVTAIEENCCDGCYVQSPLLQDSRHTNQVGTKLYMSPEQVRSHTLLMTSTNLLLKLEIISIAEQNWQHAQTP